MDIGVTTRPVRPDDGPRLCRMWSRLSRETVYRRFHAPLHRLPADTLAHLVGVDHHLHEALIAEVGGEVVGVARYDRSPADPATAEVAVVVEDGWQGVGVGRQLLRELFELAGRRGVATLAADVQVDNERVVGLVRRLLPDAHLTPADGVYAVAAAVPGVPAMAGG